MLIRLPVDAAAVASEFARILEATVGVFLDATTGFTINRQRNLETRDISLASISKELKRSATDDDWRSRSFLYGYGNPNDPSTRVHHASTIGDFLDRTAPDGPNELFMARMSIVSLAAAWNDSSRLHLAKTLNVDTATLASPIFGDVTKLRNDIVHHRAIATARNAGRTEVVRRRHDGDSIDIGSSEFLEIAGALREGLYDLLLTFDVPEGGIESRDEVPRR